MLSDYDSRIEPRSLEQVIDITDEDCRRKHPSEIFEVRSVSSGCGSSIKSQELRLRIQLLDERRMVRLKLAEQEEEYFSQKLQLLALLGDSLLNDDVNAECIGTKLKANVSAWLQNYTNEPEMDSASASNSDLSEQQQSDSSTKPDSPLPNLPVQQVPTEQQMILPNSFGFDLRTANQLANGSGLASTENDLPGLSPSQLAARQVIENELPLFAGDPLEWQMFYSAFQTTSEACGFSDVENLSRLRKCLRGLALECVSSRLLLPACVPRIIETLQNFFGRPEFILEALVKKVRKAPGPKPDDLYSLIMYGIAVQNLVDSIIMLQQQDYLSNPMLLNELVSKLPIDYLLRWVTFKTPYKKVDLSTFNEYMSDLVQLAVGVTNLFELDSIHNKNHSTQACVYCRASDHDITFCDQFCNLKIDSRWKVVRQAKLCKICLGTHAQKRCFTSTNNHDHLLLQT